LKPFESLDLLEIVEAAKREPGLTPEKVRVAQAGGQIQQILNALGIERGKSPDWQSAFYLLAIAVLGVGHVAYTPRRSNRSANKWDKARPVFIAMMYELTKDGQSDREAIEIIARDPARWSKLPYAQRGTPKFGGKKEMAKRAEALRRQLNRMKQRWGDDPLARALGLEETPAISPLERKLRDLQLGPLVSRPNGDKRKG
jgi:hypothetical protein